MNPSDQTYSLDTSDRVSISHFVHTLKRYRPVIVISMIAVAIGYAILAVFIYLMAPAQRVTSLRFRLDFEGSTKDRYPNGARFSIADIVSGPILEKAYKASDLKTFGVSFPDFSRSIFVLESNTAAEALAAEYQARLADTRLSSVDRERIQTEYEFKLQSIAKNEYSINLMRPDSLKKIPEELARKVLLDVLNGWADFAVHQQKVLSYRITVLSPNILRPNGIELTNPIAGIEVLRRKASIVILNTRDIEALPSGNLVRTPGDNVSLGEIRLRLEEIIRFRLEPLVAVVKTAGLIADQQATIRFVESQLAFDERQLQAKLAEADSQRQALAMYERPLERMPPQGAERRAEAQPGNNGSETVMPQLSETFLDRLMTLSDRAADAVYRQRLVDRYRDAVFASIPLQQAVAYDKQLLAELRSIPTGRGTLDNAAVNKEIEQSRQEVAQLIEKSNELYRLISRNMTASTELFELTSTATTRTARSYNLMRLALYGILVMLIALPVIVAACLLHNRIREEEIAEQYVEAPATAS